MWAYKLIILKYMPSKEQMKWWYGMEHHNKVTGQRSHFNEHRFFLFKTILVHSTDWNPLCTEEQQYTHCM